MCAFGFVKDDLNSFLINTGLDLGNESLDFIEFARRASMVNMRFAIGTQLLDEKLDFSVDVGFGDPVGAARL